MGTITGTVLGALIAGCAMLINAYITSKDARERQQRSDKIRFLDKEINDLTNLYEETIQICDRLIRNKGRDDENKLEQFYKIESKLRLHANEEIINALQNVKSSIIEMTKSLPLPPKDIIPKFEDDSEKRIRISKFKSWENERDTAAQAYMPKCWGKLSELTELLKSDLHNRKLKY